VFFVRVRSMDESRAFFSCAWSAYGENTGRTLKFPEKLVFSTLARGTLGRQQCSMGENSASPKRTVPISAYRVHHPEADFTLWLFSIAIRQDAYSRGGVFLHRRPTEDRQAGCLRHCADRFHRPDRRFDQVSR